MASSYALPSSALPHAHHQHMHSHSHSSSGSPAPLNAWKSSISSSNLQPNSHANDPSDNDSQHGHNHSGHSHAANSHAARPRMPPPPNLSSLSGWKSESTAGGRTIITTPATATFSPLYEPPDLRQDGGVQHHQHRHDPHLSASQGHDDNHTHEHGHGHSHVHDVASIGGHGDKYRVQLDHNTHLDADGGVGASVFTRLLLPYTAKWPALHSIMTEKDSRRIFYFMTLNFSFMVVQAFYGYLTDSLGLLSDSIHMFFDCVALLVGLFAAVASKWPSNRRFPYGFGKIETLSGFANGILLILLSVEITFEAFERLWEGTKTKRLTELFIVSTLGLLVNLVGMMAFGHHHHGHSHGHSHGHGHDHDHDHGHHDHHHGHGHSPDGGCGHSHNDHAAGHGHSHGHAHGHSHGHSHDNENMQGIYLHVLADTLGSASVIVSTLLTHFTGWAGWDPLASCLIAGLIALSARPLVVSAASRLLLGVPDDVEYKLRNTLAGIAQQRGVAGYAAPKFWVDDRAAAGGGEDKLLGVVHVIVARGAGLDDVRDRVRAYLAQHGVDVVVQAEREGDTSCWCGGGRGTSSAVQVSGVRMGTGPVPIPGRGAGASTLKVL